MIDTHARFSRTRCKSSGFTGRVAWICLAALSWLLLVPSGVRADAMTYYCYTGNHFTSADSPYTTNDAVSGCLALPAPLPANQPLTDVISSVSWIVFTDGIQMQGGVIRPGGINFYEAKFATQNGQITAWSIDFMTDPGGPADNIISTGNYANPLNTWDYAAVYGDMGIVLSARVDQNSGKWVVHTPEPSSLVLCLFGIFALAIMSQLTRSPK